MTYVIDANVAAKWFLREELRADAMRLLEHRSQLHAPDWITAEIAHVAFRKWRDREIGSEQATAMVQALPSFFAELYPSAVFVGRALAIAMAVRHPVYDCLYLACAEMTGGILITADDGLCNAVAETPFRARVRHLREATE